MSNNACLNNHNYFWGMWYRGRSGWQSAEQCVDGSYCRRGRTMRTMLDFRARWVGGTFRWKFRLHNDQKAVGEHFLWTILPCKAKFSIEWTSCNHSCRLQNLSRQFNRWASCTLTSFSKFRVFGLDTSVHLFYLVCQVAEFLQYLVVPSLEDLPKFFMFFEHCSTALKFKLMVLLIFTSTCIMSPQTADSKHHHVST